jgi:hypothetical protein
LQSSKWAYIFVIYIALERAKMATSYAGTHKHVREREREMLVWKEKTREERSLFMRGRSCPALVPAFYRPFSNLQGENGN